MNDDATLATLLGGELFAVLLVFARIGSAMMLLPGFGEQYVPPMARLLLALCISALLSAAVAGQAAPPAEPTALASMLIGEVALGLVAGFLARMILVAAQAAGAVLAMQSSLASAAFFDPNEGGQGTLPGMFLNAVVITAFFAADQHHLMLRLLAASYQRVPAGDGLAIDDAAALMGPTLDAAFATALALAAPLTVTTVLVNLVMASMGRLMPALQVFALAAPVQLMLYLGLTLLGTAAILRALSAMTGLIAGLPLWGG